MRHGIEGTVHVSSGRLAFSVTGVGDALHVRLDSSRDLFTLARRFRGFHRSTRALARNAAGLFPIRVSVRGREVAVLSANPGTGLSRAGLASRISGLPISRVSLRALLPG